MSPVVIAATGFMGIAGLMAGYALRVRRWDVLPLDLPDGPYVAPEPVLRGAADVTTPADRAHRVRRLRDRAGREWIAPEPCGVCASVGGHLPQCPADGS